MLSETRSKRNGSGESCLTRRRSLRKEQKMCLEKISSVEETSSKQLLDQRETFSWGAETEGGADEASAPDEQRHFGDPLRRWQGSAGACWRRRGHEETAPGHEERPPSVWWLLPLPVSSSHSLLSLLLIASSSSPGPLSPPSSSPTLLPPFSC